jgi:hypothetical protein
LQRRRSAGKNNDKALDASVRFMIISVSKPKIIVIGRVTWQSQSNDAPPVRIFERVDIT